jgi:hypothetical protein
LRDEAAQPIGIDAGGVVSRERHVLDRPQRHEFVGECDRCARREGANTHVLEFAEAEEMRDRLANRRDAQRLPGLSLDQTDNPPIRGGPAAGDHGHCRDRLADEVADVGGGA